MFFVKQTSNSLLLFIHIQLINTPALDWRQVLQRRGDPRNDRYMGDGTGTRGRSGVNGPDQVEVRCDFGLRHP